MINLNTPKHHQTKLRNPYPAKKVVETPLVKTPADKSSEALVEIVQTVAKTTPKDLKAKIDD